MARHDIICDSCSLIIRDIQISSNDIKAGGLIKKIMCPDCKNKTFHTYWGGGESPGVSVIGDDKRRIFDGCKTLGEFWDKTGVNFGSKEYNEASKAHIKQMRQKAMKKNARKGPNKSS